jgi:hypothetical protein
MKREENKRGLSTIVITLILILLSLVAVGIVWFVVNNILKSGAQGIDVGAKCLNTNVEATSVNCTGTPTASCTVRLERTGTENEAITGVKLVFRNESAGLTSSLLDSAGDIQPLVGKTVTFDTGIASADKIEVTPYFSDDSGNEQLCSQPNSFEF